MKKSIGKNNFDGNVVATNEVLSESMGKKGNLPFNDSGVITFPTNWIVSSIIVSSGSPTISGEQCAAGEELKKLGMLPDWVSHPVAVGATPLNLVNGSIDTTSAVGVIYWG